MSTLDKICELLDSRGKKQKDLTDYLGISKNTFTDWKSGRIKSYTKYIDKIAEFLGVSADYLLGTQIENQDKDNDELLKTLLYGEDNSDITAQMLEEVRNYARYLRINDKF